MKKIGCFRQEANAWTGTIAVMPFETQARIVPAPSPPSAESPDYLVQKGPGNDGFAIELGHGWVRHSRERNVNYIDISLDDPSLPRAIHGILWQDPADGLWYLYWDRNVRGEHAMERLYVQEELKPQIGIRPLSRITAHMMLFYPDLVPG